MRRIKTRLYRAAAVLALAASSGVVFQTSGCGVATNELASEVTTIFMNTLITGFVNDQFGVSNSLFF